MTLYLVRWPELAASLVMADSEDDLLDKLDQIANPEGCSWVEYDGPLHLVFTPPFDRDARGPGESLVDIPVSDEGQEMLDAVAAFAFPHLHALQDLDREPTAKELAGALLAEESRVVEASLKFTAIERSDDLAAKLATSLDTSLENARRFIEPRPSQGGARSKRNKKKR